MNPKVVGAGAAAAILLFVFGFTAGRYSHPSKEETKDKKVAAVEDHKEDKTLEKKDLTVNKKINAGPVHIHASTRKYLDPKCGLVEETTKDTIIGPKSEDSTSKSSNATATSAVTDHKALNLEEHSKIVTYQPKWLYTFRGGTDLKLNEKIVGVAVQYNVLNIAYVGPWADSRDFHFEFGVAVTIPH